MGQPRRDARHTPLQSDQLAMTGSLLQTAYRAAKPLLFRCDAERAHTFASAVMRVLTPFVGDASIKNRNPQIVFDRKIYSPIGIAAGFDKPCAAPLYLHKLGFGFVECGSLTPQAQRGNPKPRLVRLPEQEALINKMGFNNPGFIDGWKRLRSRLAVLPPEYLPALSLGKGKETPIDAARDDYVFCLEHLATDMMAEYLFYVAINVSSPNTPNLRALQTRKAIRSLVECCAKVSPRPVVVKFAPDFANNKTYRDSLAAALEGGAQGIIVTNTTTDHSLAVLPQSLAGFGGGLSGKPLAAKSRHYLKLALRETRGKVPVISSGGVFSPDEAKLRIDLGADLVQVYTGFVYYGPDFARDFLALL
jgi:dihydroorotate dehydrogenase